MTDKLADILSNDLAKWWAGRSLDDFEVMESSGGELPKFKVAITRIDYSRRQLVDFPVWLRLASGMDKIEARALLLETLSKRSNDDIRTEEAAIKMAGADTFEHLEKVWLLSRCLFRDDDPGAPYMLPELLDKCHPAGAISQVYDKMLWLEEQTNPQLTAKEVEALDKDTMHQVAVAIAERRNLSPLAAIAMPALSAFIISLASLVTERPTPKSS